MARFMMLIAALAMLAGTALAQQPQPQVRSTQPTRSYRSYSVNPTNPPRGDVRRNGPHAGDATWRHAGAKAAGHFATGR
jgi:hypothetical protein